jgi:hypothetical protein
MNKIMPLIATLILSTACFSAEEVPTKSPADLLYEKAVASNTSEASKAYGAYMKALEAANAKVIKALEAAKSDLNDPKKGKLTIAERADAIKLLDEKISKVKEGAVGDSIVADWNREDDLV